MKWLPARIIILVLFILLLCQLLFLDGPNDILGFLIGMILLFILVVSVIVELILTLFGRKITIFWRSIIFIVAVPLLIKIFLVYMFWETDTENFLYIPADYQRKSVLVVHNGFKSKEVKPNFGLKRIRKIEVDTSGIVFVSNVQALFGVKIKYYDGKDYKLSKYTQTTLNTINTELDKCTLIIFEDNAKMDIDSFYISEGFNIPRYRID